MTSSAIHTLVKPKLVRSIIAQYTLPRRGTHGIGHWARVLENGLRLAPDSGGKPEVIALFAVFHDACRQNEDWDEGHGRRGADLAAKMRGKWFELSDEDFERLHFACAHHTDGRTDADPTIQTCWDADRLDLGRVGLIPEPRRLCTAAARRSETIKWAYRRSVVRHEPMFVSTFWQVK